jgi:hypothetical protein
VVDSQLQMGRDPIVTLGWILHSKWSAFPAHQAQA